MAYAVHLAWLIRFMAMGWRLAMPGLMIRTEMIQGLTDDWRVRLAFPIFRLIDFLLSRQRVARYLFNNFRTKDNLRKVLQVSE